LRETVAASEQVKIVDERIATCGVRGEGDRFVDDVEFLLDAPACLITSARRRLGYRDPA
jgi:hypothetical protein